METKVSSVSTSSAIVAGRGGVLGDIGRRMNTVLAPTDSKVLLARYPTPTPSGPNQRVDYTPKWIASGLPTVRSECCRLFSDLF
jgi:hypothetical protein